MEGDLRFITIPKDLNTPLTTISKSDYDIFDNVKMIVYANGNVQIGSKRPTGNHTDAKLSVEGKIVAQSLFITKPVTCADYVFDKDYKLLSPLELEKFYALHYHLLEVKSEEEVKERGYNVNEMNALLLQKVEELSLYIVDLQKQINVIKNIK